MPRLKSSVPKFGKWDKSEDVSYSYAFDKARAEREMFLHHTEGDANDFLLEQSFYRNSGIAGKRTPHDIYSGKAREDRHSFLPAVDERYTHMNMLQNPENAAVRGSSYMPDTQSRGLGYNQPKSPSGVRVLPEAWNQSDPLAYNLQLPSSAPSRHTLQSGTTNEMGLFRARPHVIQEHAQYHERLHAKSTNTPRKVLYEEKATTKTRNTQGGLEVSRTATNMQRKHAVPRFGDWESGEGFTAVFNKIRLEKHSKRPLNSIVKPVSPLLQPEEDLYKASITADSPITPKKQSRWMRLICCMGQPHIVES